MRWLIVLLIIAGLLMANLWQYRQMQQQTRRTAAAEASSADRLATINQLKRDDSQRAQARQELVHNQQQLARTLNQRNQALKELQRENHAYQQWADRPLPALSQRLHSHPTFTGAGDYQQWLLSQNQSLHAASQPPNPKPGS